MYRVLERVLCPASVSRNHAILAAADEKIMESSTLRQVLSLQVVQLALSEQVVPQALLLQVLVLPVFQPEVLPLQVLLGLPQL